MKIILIWDSKVLQAMGAHAYTPNTSNPQEEADVLGIQVQHTLHRKFEDDLGYMRFCFLINKTRLLVA